MKKILTIIVCFMLVLGALTGCNFTKNEMNKVDPNAPDSDKPQLKILLPYVSDSMNQNKAIPLINDITGYTTSYDQLPTGGNADTNINNMFTDSKAQYNAIKLTKNQFNRFAIKAAAIADLTDAVNNPKYAKIKSSISKEAWEAVTFNGKILGIPDSASNNNIDKSIIIRKDLMLGLTNARTGQKFTEAPKTYEDFVELLKAFKASTGKKTALSLPKNIQVVAPIAASFGVEQMWQDIGGELKHAVENPALSSYVTAMQSLKQNELLDGAMQSNTFQTCATNFAKGDCIATVSNFWEMENIANQLGANRKIEDYVDFAYGFSNSDGEVKTFQSSGVSYVTVVPNWMAASGVHVMNYVQSKIQDDNFVKLVCGTQNEHYQYNSITEEFEPLAKFNEDKISADHFVTGTNDGIYNRYWTQVVIKGNKNYYYQWRATNTDAFNNDAHKLIGVLDPTKYAPPMKEYSARAAGMEDYFNTEITKMIYGNNSGVTIESILSGWKSGDNAAAVTEIKDWYKNSK